MAYKITEKSAGPARPLAEINDNELGRLTTAPEAFAGRVGQRILGVNYGDAVAVLLDNAYGVCIDESDGYEFVPLPPGEVVTLSNGGPAPAPRTLDSIDPGELGYAEYEGERHRVIGSRDESVLAFDIDDPGAWFHVDGPWYDVPFTPLAPGESWTLTAE